MRDAEMRAFVELSRTVHANGGDAASAYARSLGLWLRGHIDWSSGSSRFDVPAPAASETLRLHTPNWILMRRAVAPLHYGGALLRPGAEILFSPAALHRSPSPSPSSAAPEIHGFPGGEVFAVLSWGSDTAPFTRHMIVMKRVM
ncbi:hypothetical protein ACFRMQ_02090 [Kitasatospora sp. NPDC056783]|uniref:hypothetical protein n=1 Tax=Kitasatospora sp. NPDC056783 TaxID=3345943 RepID=UPI003698A15C